MLIRVGYEISISSGQPTPLICLVAPHVSRQGDFTGPELVETDPQVPIHSYFDLYGNICRRMIAPAGLFTLRGDVTMRDSGLKDEVALDAQEWPVEALPDNVLTFLTGSRYVETDLISQEAWDLFGHLTPGWGRVQQIVDYTHARLSFDYMQARATRTAAEAQREQIGVCRDYAHLALAFLRALNIPARYVNGYLGFIGVPDTGAVMDFSAWIEVFLGGKWYTFDPRNNAARIGRVVVARGHDAADVPLINSFGQHQLETFLVWGDAVDARGQKIDGMAFA